MTRDELLRAYIDNTSYITDSGHRTYVTSASDVAWGNTSISNADFMTQLHDDWRNYRAYTYNPVTMQYKTVTISPTYLEEEFARSPELEEYINQFKIKDKES